MESKPIVAHKHARKGRKHKVGTLQTLLSVRSEGDPTASDTDKVRKLQ